MFSENGFFEAVSHTRETIELAAHIRATQNLKMIDATHAATAIRAKCSHFIAHDGQIYRNTKGIDVTFPPDESGPPVLLYQLSSPQAVWLRTLAVLGCAPNTQHNSALQSKRPAGHIVVSN